MWKLVKKLFLIGSVATVGMPLTAQAVKVEQALIVTTRDVAVTPKEIFAIEDELTLVFQQHSVGFVDGNEIAVDGSEALIYMYGPDAEAMFAAALPILKSHHATASSQAMLRFGDVSDENARVEVRLIKDVQWKQ